MQIQFTAKSALKHTGKVWNTRPGKLLRTQPKQALYSTKANLAFCTKAGFHPMGDTFHFLDVPGSRKSPQYIFLIHNHQLWIPFSTILYTLFTTIHTIIHTKYQPISFSQISKYHSYFPSRNSISLSTIFFPPRGILSLDKNIPKCTTIPYPTCTHKSLTFPHKIPKNGLKSLFLNRYLIR